MHDFISIKNIKILLKTDKLILVNETTFCSLAIILFILKIFKKIDVYVFVMGLYSKKLRFPIFKFLHYSIIKFFISTCNNLFFLGEGEYKKAKQIHTKFSQKFVLFPFYIDTSFWKKDLENNKRIIFYLLGMTKQEFLNYF